MGEVEEHGSLLQTDQTADIYHAAAGVQESGYSS